MSTATPTGRESLRIGEVAARTGVSTRMIRYYESKGLIVAGRSPTGQRVFDPAVVDVIAHIRLLLDAGLPTAAINELLDCIHQPGRLEPCAVPVLLDHLRDYDARIAQLADTRHTLSGLIEASTRQAR